MKHKKSSDQDFLYSTARIRALENEICSNEQFALLSEARGEGELRRLLGEAGLEGDSLFEAVDKRLQAAYALVSELAGSDAFDVLRFPYDAHNLKSMIKADIRDMAPEGLLLQFGTVPIDRLQGLWQNRDFTPFPFHMANAVGSAIEAYAKTKDPQKIDTILDKACYQDMLAGAEQAELPFLLDAIRMKIDLTNLLTVLRLLRMNSAQNSQSNNAFVKEHLIDGGMLPLEQLTKLFDGGEEALFGFLALGGYPILAKLGQETSLAAFERAADDEYMCYIRDHTKYIAFGGPVLCAYLAARETEAKNFRILIASVRNGISPAEIKERLRFSYV
ncbi:MAG: V-type ATPase subunit [Clostridiales bacterium]|nr:V-type ATPase subunit [Clostridiales bacterium]